LPITETIVDRYVRLGAKGRDPALEHEEGHGMTKRKQYDQSRERDQHATSPSEPRPLASPPEPQPGKTTGEGTECRENECRVDLTEEYLTPEKHPVLEGEVRIHKEVESVLQHLVVEAEHDEVSVEHQPINQVVDRRRAPWQEDDTIVIPIYEEQVVVTRRLVLKEKLRVRRVRVTERQHLAEEVHRERPVVEEFGRPGVVQERVATEPRPEAKTGRRKTA